MLRKIVAFKKAGGLGSSKEVVWEHDAPVHASSFPANEDVLDFVKRSSWWLGVLKEQPNAKLVFGPGFAADYCVALELWDNDGLLAYKEEFVEVNDGVWIRRDDVRGIEDKGLQGLWVYTSCKSFLVGGTNYEGVAERRNKLRDELMAAVKRVV